MGLDLNGVHFLLYAKNLGVDFKKTAMIGRQSLDLTKSELKKSFQDFNFSFSREVIDHIFNHKNGYAEPLLAALGSNDIHSFDFSAYEGATHLHDMNQLISPEAKEQYSVVLDGGSLEHIFNFPVAIKNCMEMLEIGGHYLGITPANNFAGHGFYQFSPEMYFSVFSNQNGFEIISLTAFEDRPDAPWFLVKNPEEIKKRVLLTNDQPVYLLVVAKRVAKKIVFETLPQQSDYLSTWKNDEVASSKRSPNKLCNSLTTWVKRNLPFPLRYLAKFFFQGYGFDKRFFIQIDPTTRNFHKTDNGNQKKS